MRRFTAALSALVLVFLLGTGSTWASDEYGPYQDAINSDTEWSTGGGVIRLAPGTVNQMTGEFSSGGPYVHANSAHVAVGIQHIYVKGSGVGGGDLIVEHDNPGRVTSISCDPDETIAALATAGVSGGIGEMVIRFYRLDGTRLYLHHQDDYDYISGTYNNIWLEWKGPKVRGSGGPSLTQRIAELEARVTALENQ
jgi:hypothetical protein